MLFLFFFLYLFFVIFFCCLIRDIFRYLGFFCSSNYASVEQHVKEKKVSYCRAFLVFSFLFPSFLFHLFDQRQLLRLKFLAPWNCAWVLEFTARKARNLIPCSVTILPYSFPTFAFYDLCS